MKNITTLFALLFVVVLFSCNKDMDAGKKSTVPVLPDTPYEYVINNPNGFDQDVNDHVATLGRVLFYDEKLSANNSTSCSSCHLQSKGFADDKAFSQGFRMTDTKRNSIAIVSPSMKSNFFWDARTNSLGDQVLMPIQDHIEMGINDMDALLNHLQEEDYYNELFTAAFGDEEINASRVSDALSSFISTINPYQSKFDEGLTSENAFNGWNTPEVAGLTPQEQQGMDLFFTKFQCTNCHSGVNFDGGGWIITNIGLEMNYTDLGMAAWTNDESNVGMFMAPSLRNVELTGPYMHDGRFNTLHEVLNHYSEGIQPHPNLDWNLREIPDDILAQFDQLPSFGNFAEEFEEDFLESFAVTPSLMHMTDEEKDAIAAFLHTLTDRKIMHDPKYSDPFVLVD